MINLVTGTIKFNNVVITPNTTINDLLQYNDVLSIKTRKNNCIARFNHLINSNGIDASIKIQINEIVNLKEIIITPSLANTNGMTLLDASKIWFKGVTKGDYIEKDDIITGKYDWGYINAQYIEDRDYGIIGGEIIIHYN